jgi:hypothetical protein
MAVCCTLLSYAAGRSEIWCAVLQSTTINCTALLCTALCNSSAVFHLALPLQVTEKKVVSEGGAPAPPTTIQRALSGMRSLSRAVSNRFFRSEAHGYHPAATPDMQRGTSDTTPLCQQDSLAIAAAARGTTAQGTAKGKHRTVVEAGDGHVKVTPAEVRNESTFTTG